MFANVGLIQALNRLKRKTKVSLYQKSNSIELLYVLDCLPMIFFVWKVNLLWIQLNST